MLAVNQISLELLEHLRKLLEERKIDPGIRILESLRPELAQIAAAHPLAGLAASCLAQWVDVGFDDHGLLEALVRKLEKHVRQSLPLQVYVHVRLAEGMLAMRREDASANQHLDAVINLEEEVEDGKLGIIARLWKARSLRKTGEYEQALQLSREALQRAEALQLSYLAAVLRTLESWMVFQKGEAQEASVILQAAEAVLHETDDYITLGNIQSAYGRIAMQEGRYEHALRYFEASIVFFERRPTLQGYLARSLSNMAQAKRNLALQLRRNLEAQHERERGTLLLSRRMKAGRLERMHELLTGALADLEKAGEIYHAAGNHHGSGNVAVNAAQVYLDRGDLDEAEARAGEAFRLGAKKGDFLVMCRARIVQAALQNARYEEEIGEGEDPSKHAQHAIDSAKEAVDLAEKTQSRHLVAEAQLCYGATLVNGFFQNTEAARACCSRAEAALGHDRHDALWEEVELLRARILHTGIEDPNLRAWSEGSVGGKSLQQVVGEFEELLIRRVWEREGRKVSRVAQELSVSPKKVRRVLRQLGLLSEFEAADS
jgi:tetratricopeptide (TPR) repeat protein